MIKVKVKTVKVNDRGAKQIKREVKKLKKTFALVGFPGDLPMHKDSDMTIPEIAAVNEFGTLDGRIPSRPFMRNAADNKSNKSQFYKILGRELGKIEDTKQTAKGALRSAGEWYIGVLKTAIKKGPFKPNAESTKAKKGSSTPLIDTGQMRNSITSRILQGNSRSK